jgi:hypothetical protein
MKHISNNCAVKYIREISDKVAGEVVNLVNKKRAVPKAQLF